MTKTLALVGCGSEKREQAVEAKSLYTSNYFAKKRQWAEGCHAWRILSAEHGVVQPSAVLEPYDTAMGDLSDAEADDWGTEVINQLRPQINTFDEVVVLAGLDYFEPIRDDLYQLPPAVRWPFQGKRLFEQMEWLEHNSPPDQSTIDSFR